MKDKLHQLIYDYVEIDEGYKELCQKVFDEYIKTHRITKEQVKHTLTLDKNKLYADNINDTIAYLNQLKNNGYTSIEEEWTGYESYRINACINEDETDLECALRHAAIINKQIELTIKKRDDNQRKLDEIKRLEQKIRDIRKTIAY